ncbi:MAG: 2-hydroxychromene-2-carboxylate isomerase, partial [Pseudomonadota bacterium]
DWFFDYISPYPYLQLGRFADLPPDLIVHARPVLFAGLLNHWGHKGPAEIPAKALQTYRYTRWLADRRGLPFAGPPRHPFNPLALLRLTIHLGATLDVVRVIYEHVWGEGRDGQSEESLAELAEKLGVDDLAAAVSAPEVKAQLKTNTDAAIAQGVYGVPTFAWRGTLFWGDDATDMFLDALKDPEMFERPAFARAASMEPAAIRTPRPPGAA